MDDLKNLHALSNSSKSTRGNALNKRVENHLILLKKQGFIDSFWKEPRFSIQNKNEQFRPDFLLSKDGEFIVIDNTNTIRSDRLKQKQWDALGTRLSLRQYHKKIRCYIVIPNEEEIGTAASREKEWKHIHNAKKRLLQEDGIVFLDDILTVQQLLSLLTTPLKPTPNEERIQHSIQLLKGL